jgi:phosphohistidine swiveling domain-containing protein
MSSGDATLTDTSSAPTPGPLHQLGSPSTAWTTVNAFEVVPSVLTPLGASCFWGDPNEVELRRGYAGMGVIPRSEVKIPDSVDDRNTATVYGRFVANVDAIRKIADSMPGTSGNAVEQQIFGTVRAGVANRPTRRRYPVLAWKLPLAFALMPRRIHAVRAAGDRWWRALTIDAPPRTREDAAAGVRAASERYRAAMWLHMQATMFGQGLYEQVALLARSAGRPGLELELITGYGGVAETQILKDLWSLANGELTREEFIGRHGYHGPGEGEPMNPSWRENPSALEPMIRVYRDIDAAHSPAATERAQIAQRERTEADLLGSLGPVARARARLVLQLARRYIRVKEESKTAYIQAIDGGRSAAHVLGRVLVGEGALTEPTDVFFLAIDELFPIPADARALVARRRADHDRFSAVTLPTFWSGVPDVTPALASTADDAAADVLVSGIPVCPGVVEGVAHVIADPDLDGDFRPGDVLVCRLTDPAWMPIINIAGALVIDIGGPLSHCAIAARELGIPAVVNTGNGTRVIRTGDHVRVDAAAGTVEVIRLDQVGQRSR